MKRFLCYWLMAVLLLSIVGCGNANDPNSEETVPNEFKNIELTRSEQECVRAQNQISLKLFNADVNSNELTHNKVLSTLSAALELAMLANGLEGDEKAQLLSALAPEDFDLERMNLFYKNFVEALRNADNRIDIKFSNIICSDEEHALNRDYAYRIKESYSADFLTIDRRSTSSEGVSALNDWAVSNSGGLITKKWDIAHIPSVLIANMMYFKGIWKSPFPEANTQEEVFYNLGNNDVLTDMMHSTILNVGYADEEEYAAIQLPYGNGAYRFYAIMPTDDSLFLNLIRNFDLIKWQSVKDSMKPMREVELWMPKFEVGYGCDLAGLLQKIGINNFMERSGALAGISTGLSGETMGLSQNSVLKIDEQGATAVSISSSTTAISPGPADEDEVAVMRINRPFIFLIEEQSTGALLFVGEICNL